MSHAISNSLLHFYGLETALYFDLHLLLFFKKNKRLVTAPVCFVVVVSTTSDDKGGDGPVFVSRMVEHVTKSNTTFQSS